MDVDGLQQTEGHPGPQEEHVVTEDHDADEETGSQDESLGGMSVFRLHAERSLKDGGHDVTRTFVCVCVVFLFVFIYLTSMCVMYSR